MSTPRPIIVVTGANSGVGFGICHRLLVQLSQSTTPDAEPQFKSLFPGKAPQDDAPTETYDGLTLIMACRSQNRALGARTKLLRLLDKHVEEERHRPSYDGHAERFRQNVEIHIHCVDMCIMKSVFEFCDELVRRYPYISHLICNAGAAFWSGADKIHACRAIVTKGLSYTVTIPPFTLQHTGVISGDGLGATWQSNVFGHYTMYRHLTSMFVAYAKKASRPARVIWMSSLEAQPCWYDHEDWQLVKTDHSYESSKYQIDLIVGRLAQLSQEPGGEGNIVMHFNVHPGITHSNMANGMVHSVLNILKVILFYLARWLGSINHPITPYKAAVVATHVALASILAIPNSLLAFTHVSLRSDPPISLWEESLQTMDLFSTGAETATRAREMEEKDLYVPMKFGSITDRWGHERVNALTVLQWDQFRKESASLVEKCENLYQAFLKIEKEDKAKARPAN